MITREQLELAAKAAGIGTLVGYNAETQAAIVATEVPIINMPFSWNPLTDHGQLLDLAMACGMIIDFEENEVKALARDTQWPHYNIHSFSDFTSLAECVITAAAEQQLAKEKK